MHMRMDETRTASGYVGTTQRLQNYGAKPSPALQRQWLNSGRENIKENTNDTLSRNNPKESQEIS